MLLYVCLKPVEEERQMARPTSMESHVGHSSFHPGKLHNKVNKDRDFSQVHLVDFINNSVSTTKRKCCWQIKQTKAHGHKSFLCKRAHFFPCTDISDSLTPSSQLAGPSLPPLAMPRMITLILSSSGLLQPMARIHTSEGNIW